MTMHNRRPYRNLEHTRQLFQAWVRSNRQWGLRYWNDCQYLLGNSANRVAIRKLDDNKRRCNVRQRKQSEHHIYHAPKCGNGNGVF